MTISGTTIAGDALAVLAAVRSFYQPYNPHSPGMVRHRAHLLARGFKKFRHNCTTSRDRVFQEFPDWTVERFDAAVSELVAAGELYAPTDQPAGVAIPMLEIPELRAAQSRVVYSTEDGSIVTSEWTPPDAT